MVKGDLQSSSTFSSDEVKFQLEPNRTARGTGEEARKSLGSGKLLVIVSERFSQQLFEPS